MFTIPAIAVIFALVCVFLGFANLASAGAGVAPGSQLAGIRERIRELDAEMGELLGEEGEDKVLTEDEEQRYDGLKKQFDELMAQATKLEAAKKRLDERRAARAKLQKSPLLAPTAPTVPGGSSTGGEDPALSGRMYDRVIDDPKGGFATPREFIACVIQAGRTDRVPNLLATWEQAVQAAAGSDEHRVSSDPEGGFLVPPAFSPTLLMLQHEGDILQPFVRMVPMASGIQEWPARVDKDHSESVSGGLQWHWKGETTEGDTSKMKFEQVTLKAFQAIGAAHATHELLRDSPLAFAQIIASGFGEEWRAFITEARLRGTGVGQILGILNSGAILEVEKENGQAAGSIVKKNVLKMFSRCYRPEQAVWIANLSVLPELGSIESTNGQQLWMWSLQDGVPSRLVGRPLFWTDHLPAVGNANDLMFVNMQEYLQGEREGPRADVSIHVRFLRDEETLRFIRSVAGSPWWRSVLTPKNGPTRSPFVTLAERA